MTPPPTTSRAPARRTSAKRRASNRASPQWYVTAYRSALALLVIVAALGYLVITHQQREVATLRGEVATLRTLGIASVEPEPSDRAPPETETPKDEGTTGAVPTTPPPAPAPRWAVRDVHPEVRCGDPAFQQRLIYRTEDGAERVVVDALPRGDAFGVALLVPQPSDASRVILSSIPCGERIPADGDPLRSFTDATIRYWTAAHDGAEVAEIGLHDLLQCPEDLTGVFHSTALSFCYPSAWGSTTSVALDASGGTASMGGFAARFRTNTSVRVELRSTTATPADRTFLVPHILDLSRDDTAIRRRIEESGVTVNSLERRTVAGTPAIRVTVVPLDAGRETESLAYVVPDALRVNEQSYTFSMLADAALGDALDPIMATVTFGAPR